jgi:iron complex transport system ATP-binding protein
MIINLEQLFFAYSDTDVLRGIDLRIGEAEIVSIIGPNGSGKSTLIKCIECLNLPRSGRVLLDGIDARKISGNDIAKLLGYVPQSSSHTYSTTVFDTVLMGRRPYSAWLSSQDDIEKVALIIEHMDLSDIALKDYNCLSGGQQQRVLIARALAQEPKALLLDEPTSALDIAHQLQLMDTIQDLAEERGITVVMVLHDLNLASKYADRIVLLDQGKIRAEGSAKEVLTRDNMANVYGIEALVTDTYGEISIQPICRCGAKPRKRKKQKRNMRDQKALAV